MVVECFFGFDSPSLRAVFPDDKPDTLLIAAGMFPSLFPICLVKGHQRLSRRGVLRHTSGRSCRSEEAGEVVHLN